MDYDHSGKMDSFNSNESDSLLSKKRGLLQSNVESNMDKPNVELYI